MIHNQTNDARRARDRACGRSRVSANPNTRQPPKAQQKFNEGTSASERRFRSHKRQQEADLRLPTVPSPQRARRAQKPSVSASVSASASAAMLLHNRATRCNNTDGAQWHEYERSTKTQTHTQYYNPNKQGKHASASVSAGARPAPESDVRRAVMSVGSADCIATNGRLQKMQFGRSHPTAFR